MKNYNCNVTCDNFEDNCIYTSVTFWGFVLLMSLGNIGFNVSNCISDAICFDVLGKWTVKIFVHRKIISVRLKLNQIYIQINALLFHM